MEAVFEGPVELTADDEPSLAFRGSTVAGVLRADTVAFTSGQVWTARRQRRRWRLADEQDTVLATGRRRLRTTFVEHGESVYRLHTGFRLRRRRTGRLVDARGEITALIRMEYRRRFLGQEGMRARWNASFEGLIEVHQSVAVPPLLLGVIITAGRWSARLPPIGEFSARLVEIPI